MNKNLKNNITKSIKILSIILIIIFNTIFFAGCVDSRDINDKLISTCVAFDLKGDEIIFYIEIVKIDTSHNDSGGGGGGGSGSEKHIHVTGKGKTLVEVRDNINTQLEKPIYLSGINVILFSENFAKKYLLEYLYRFRSDENYRKKAITVITRDDPEKLLNKAHEEKTSVGELIDGILMALEYDGKTFTRSTMRILENLSSRYTGVLMPCMGLENEKVAFKGYSVINGSTVTGFIPVEEANELTYLKADNPKFLYIIPYEDINFTIEVLQKNRLIKATYKDSKAKFTVELKYVAELEYGDKKTPYNLDESDMKKIGRIIKNQLKVKFADSVKQAQQEFKCDYLQFDDVFRIKYPDIFEKIDWQQVFSNAEVKFDIEVNAKVSHGFDYGCGEQK